LADRNLLIIYLPRDGTPKTFEALFLKENFLHLSGLDPINRTKIGGAKDFFDVCIQERLSADDFQFDSSGDSHRKLLILPQIVKIGTTAKMFGEFGGGGRFLYTERLSGGEHYCLGFIKSGSVYVPNTALQEDIRAVSKKPVSRVISIFSKSKNEDRYNTLNSIAKGYSLNSPSLQSILAQYVDLSTLKQSFGAPSHNAD
jgi:hypothetical protein